MTNTILPAKLSGIAGDVIRQYVASGRLIATAESCTGGLISAALTEVAGSSAVLLCGYVTYSNEAKIRDLGVDAALVEQYGAVSVEVASAMASGALQRSGADVAVAVTGVAGPGGGTEEKPVGTVAFGLAKGSGNATKCHCELKSFGAEKSRSEIRELAAEHALGLLLAA